MNVSFTATTSRYRFCGGRTRVSFDSTCLDKFSSRSASINFSCHPDTPSRAQARNVEHSGQAASRLDALACKLGISPERLAPRDSGLWCSISQYKPRSYSPRQNRGYPQGCKKVYMTYMCILVFKAMLMR